MACGSPEELFEGDLRRAWEHGKMAWPDVDLDAVVLARYVGERACEHAASVAGGGELRAADLFLACACAEGLPAALRAFDRAFLDKLDVYLRSLRPTPELVAETRQVLLEKLFVGSADRPPRIRQYQGQGPLEGWVRVAAVRTALHLVEKRAGGPRIDEAEAIASAVAPEGDPELELLRATYKDEFLGAFRSAIADLSRRDRALLRFTFVEHLTPAHIGEMYGCHRTTAMRWIEAARDDVLARTRARMGERLRISPSECDRIVALVRSRIDFTVSSLLATAT